RGFTAMVVKDGPLPKTSRGQYRWHRSQQKRPIGRGKHVHDVNTPEAKKAWQIEGLIEHSPYIGVAPKPPKPAREARIDGNERHRIALALKLVRQEPCLHAVASQDLRAGC